MSLTRIWLLPLILLPSLLSGCASNPNNAQLSERQYYEEAQDDMNHNNLPQAIDKLQSLESHYPFGRYAAQAKLDLIYCHYKSLDYDSASADADRFINTYPDNPQLDYAYYMKGLASYSVDRGLLERFLPSDFSERDMGPARESFEDFNRLINRFPNSVYAKDAQQRMIYLRNLMAAYELKAANFYMRRGAYVAAADRGRYVVDSFDTTPSVPAALVIMAKAYSELGLDKLEQSTVEVLRTNYPHNPALNAKGELNYVPGKLRHKTLLNVVTFGLFD